MNKFKIISLIGAPCSGKGTLAKKLEKELNYKHVSTGDLFRENILKNTEIGKKAKYFVENGLLCPDELGFEIVLDFFKNNNYNIILDGFPRTINDYNFIKKNNIKIEKYIFLEVSKEELIKRSQKRLIIEKRKEDALEVFLKRLDVFEEKTMPLINELKSQNILTLN